MNIFSYKWWYSRIGGRPWTFISRDFYHKMEYLVLVSIFTGGYFVGGSELVSLKWFIIIMAVYTIGFIHGHFFWGKSYIPGETEDRRKRVEEKSPDRRLR